MLVPRRHRLALCAFAVLAVAGTDALAAPRLKPFRPPLRPHFANQKAGKADAQPAPGGQVVTPNDTRKLTETERKKARFHMDFDKVDILEVIKYIAQWTNKNFILPDNIRGRITIIGPTDVTADEAYDAFLAALEANNLAVTQTGKFLKVGPRKDTGRSPIPTFLSDSSGPIPLNEQLVTKLFRMKYTDADPIKNVVQQFITRNGEIVPYPPDVLIITDDAENIVRVGQIIDALDQPGSADEINVVQVEHANAQELSAILLQIFQKQGGPNLPGGRRPTFVPMARRAGEMQQLSGAGQQESGGEVSKIIPDERTNKLIVIAGAKAFERVDAIIKQLDVPTDTGQVHVYYLENASAEELASTLSNLAQGLSNGRKRPPGMPAMPGAPGSQGAALFSGEVKVTAEKSTNSLLIVASPSDYRNMVKVIQKLDIRRRQVFIEAVIMEVKLNGENKFGLDVHSGYAFTNVKLPGTDAGVAPLVVGSELSSPGASLNLAGLASMSGFLAGIQGPPINVSGVNITLPSFGVILNALQTNSDVNVISTPHIMTSDNEDAEIAVGSSVPFQTAISPSLGGLSSLGSLGALGTAGLTGTSAATSLLGLGGLGSLGGFGLGGIVPIQRQPVELRMKIKPQINESDYVKLDIDVQNEEISSIDPQRGPTTSKRSIKTTVVAKDQSTVVIGGLIQERTTRGETKVPILGSLPVLGALFRNTDIIRERTNLLIFLTPYVIRDQSDFRRIFERKMKERQEFVSRFFGNTEQYKVTVDYARKLGPLANLRDEIEKEFQKAENGGPGSPNEHVVTPNMLPAKPESPPAPPATTPPAPPAGARPPD